MDEASETGAARRRQALVERLRRRGVGDARVLEAMAQVPRHLFVPEAFAAEAYEDRPLPIGEGQTISQPTMVAVMLGALRLEGAERVLEVGTGSGWEAALLSRLAAKVWTVELLAPLAERARAALRRLGCDNVEVVVGDGSLGWPAAAPYDAIVVAAGAPELPPPLLSQLADGGRLVAPVGRGLLGQSLVRVTRRGDASDYENLGACAFVPLRGTHGWPRPDPDRE